MRGDKKLKGLQSFLISEYRNLVSYAKRYLNERYYRVNAEDIIQDLALKLFDRMDIDAQVENVAGYVYRSLQNRIRDIKRKKRKEIPFEEYNDDDEPELIIKSQMIDDSSPLKEIDDPTFYKRFYDALSTLSPSQQAVIIKTEIEGYTFDELAEEWEIPVGTLLSWKHRGIKKLKENIKLDDFYIEHKQN